MAGRKKKATKRRRGKKTELDESKLKKIIDPRLINAMSHPARVHVLVTLNERVASPTEVADEICVEPNYISYHFEELLKNDFIELVGVEPRRGFEEHFYRAKATFLIDNRECARMPAPLRSAVSTDLFQSILAEVVDALKAGTFDARPDRHLSWIPLLVDEKGWRDLCAILDEAMEKVLVVQAKSAERMAATGEEPISATVAIMDFETPADTAPGGTAPASTA